MNQSRTKSTTPIPKRAIAQLSSSAVALTTFTQPRSKNGFVYVYTNLPFYSIRVIGVSVAAEKVVVMLGGHTSVEQLVSLAGLCFGARGDGGSRGRVEALRQ